MCDECVEGFFVDPSSGECKVCPKGAVCDGGRALPYSAEGYWQDSTSVEYLAMDHYKCEFNVACVSVLKHSKSLP